MEVYAQKNIEDFWSYSKQTRHVNTIYEMQYQITACTAIQYTHHS